MAEQNISAAVAPEPPYPAETRARGWRFEIDYEQLDQSDTWDLAAELPMAQHCLLMLWLVAWRQDPCGSLPNDESVIRAKCKIPQKVWVQCRGVLMRGWWLASDGRLYHDTITFRVFSMLEKRAKDAKRTADRRARLAESRGSHADVTRDATVSNTRPTREFDTKHQAPNTNTSVPNGTGGEAPPVATHLEPKDVVFALGVPLITAAGVAEKNARSFLAMQCKSHGPAKVAEALRACAASQAIAPITWLQAHLQPKTGGKHSGFAAKDYRAGVSEDGSLT